MRASAQPRQTGFTLVELLVTMSIVVILLTVGVSGLTTMVKRNTRAAEVNSMLGHLNFARAQAVMRARDITVCPVDTSDVAAGCVANTKAWADGYAVIEAGSGEVLRVETATGRLDVVSTRNAFTFEDDGTLTTPVGGNISFCDADGDGVDPRRIVISGMGRTRLEESADISCD
jgi:type IV fimbrial biogenesis protein FimT